MENTIGLMEGCIKVNGGKESKKVKVQYMKKTQVLSKECGIRRF